MKTTYVFGFGVTAGTGFTLLVLLFTKDLSTVFTATAGAMIISAAVATFFVMFSEAKKGPEKELQPAADPGPSKLLLAVIGILAILLVVGLGGLGYVLTNRSGGEPVVPAVTSVPVVSPTVT